MQLYRATRDQLDALRTTTTRPAPSRGRVHPTGRPPCGRGATPQRCTTRCAATGVARQPPAGPHRTPGGPMKLIIAGSRTFTDYQRLCQVLAPDRHRIAQVITGGARGADQLGYRWAWKHAVQASALPRGVGALRQVRRHAPQSPDGPGWRRPRRVLGRPIARHRAHDPVHGAAGQTRDRGALRAMNGPAGATVAGCGVTASAGARRSIARSRAQPGGSTLHPLHL